MNTRPHYRASYGDYVHGTVVPEASPARKNRFEVIHGTGTSRDVEVAPRRLMTYTLVAILVIVLMAAVSVTRIMLVNASQNEIMAANELSAQIEITRKSANDLEVQQSYLSADSHIRNAAAQLNMEAPVTTTSITLGADVVVTDAAGNLSLSGSLAAMS